MPLIVQKYGGTSVGSTERIKNVARRVAKWKAAGYDVVVVVSAMSGETNRLIALAKEIQAHPDPRELDVVAATGEQVTIGLLAMALMELGLKARSYTGSQVRVLTDDTFNKARILEIDESNIRRDLQEGYIAVVAGFQGVDRGGNVTTLGRGGSDTTATALAAVLNAELCEIYTDVEGVFTTDPRLVKTARKVERISYDEMLELASLGAGVMHSRSIEFAKKYRVHLRVRPSYSDGPGTLIAPEADAAGSIVTGVAFVRNEALVSLVGLPDQPGVMSGLFTALSSARIPVDMVVQNVAREGYANVSFTIAEDEMPAAMKVIQQAAASLEAQDLTTTTGLSKVSIVGHGMQTHTGVAARMFQVLAKHKINIKVVTTSEIKISVLIERDRCSDAVLAAHEGFELDRVHASQPQVGYAANRRTGASGAATADVAADIVSRLEGMESILVSDVTTDVNQSRVTISNLPDDPGIAEEVFTAIAEGGVLVDMIVQNAAFAGRATISFTVPCGDLDRSILLLREVLERYDGSALTSDRRIGKLSITGIGLRSHTDVGRRVFKTLGDNEINVQMINTSEIKLSIVIEAKQCERALTLLRAEFGLP